MDLLQNVSLTLRNPNAFFYRRDPVLLSVHPSTARLSLAEYSFPLRGLSLAPGLGRHEFVLTSRTTVLAIYPVQGKEHMWPDIINALQVVISSPRRYLFDSVIGRGTFGTVYKALSRETGDIVAVKQIRKTTLAALKCPLEAAQKELSIMSMLPPHHNIVRVIDVFETKSCLYVVMEYIESGSLLDLIDRNALSFDTVRHIMRQLLSAVSHLHRHNVIHRDIKLENILIRQENDIIDVKLCDFGLAIRKVPRGGKLNTRVGTGYAQAPEMILAAERGHAAAYYNGGVDVWACGIVLFALLYRHIPWADDPQERAAHMTVMVRMSAFNAGSIGVMQTIEERLRTPKYMQSLLCGLLQPCVARRLSARAAMEHALFTGRKQSVLVVEDEESDAKLSFRSAARSVIAVVRAVESLQGLSEGSGKLVVV